MVERQAPTGQAVEARHVQPLLASNELVKLLRAVQPQMHRPQPAPEARVRAEMPQAKQPLAQPVRRVPEPRIVGTGHRERRHPAGL